MTNNWQDLMHMDSRDSYHSLDNCMCLLKEEKMMYREYGMMLKRTDNIIINTNYHDRIDPQHSECD